MKFQTLIIVSLLVIASCKPTDFPATAQEANIPLESRVYSYWKAWMSGDWDNVLSMIDPEIRDEFAPIIRFRAERSMAEYLGYKIIDVEIQDQQARIEYQLTVKYLHPLLAELPPQEVTSIDSWIKREGIWYRVMEHSDIDKLIEFLTNPKEVKKK